MGICQEGIVFLLHLNLNLWLLSVSFSPAFCPATPFMCMPPLQGNQLRELLQRSLDSYVSFFRKHAPVEEIDPQQDRLMWNVPPTFVLDLVEIGGGCAPGWTDKCKPNYGMHSCWQRLTFVDTWSTLLVCGHDEAIRRFAFQRPHP